jgi:hypothetical protein
LKASPIGKTSLSPSLMASYNISSVHRATCEQVNTQNRPCIVVRSWSEFRDKVEDATSFDGTTLIFCPFKITRDSTPVVYITTTVDIVCAVPRQCRLISNSRHLMINSFLDARVYIQGFVFEGARDSSIVFLKYNHESDDKIPHFLCDVEFIR